YEPGESNPRDPDSDDDGLSDPQEVILGPALCSDTCFRELCLVPGEPCTTVAEADDGVCHDGGPGSVWLDMDGDGAHDNCAFGTDCTDCGERTEGTGTDPSNPDTDGD